MNSQDTDAKRNAKCKPGRLGQTAAGATLHSAPRFRRSVIAFKKQKKNPKKPKPKPHDFLCGAKAVPKNERLKQAGIRTGKNICSTSGRVFRPDAVLRPWQAAACGPVDHISGARVIFTGTFLTAAIVRERIQLLDVASPLGSGAVTAP